MTRTVTLSRSEYQRLRDIAKRFELAQTILAGHPFAEPPTRDAKHIMREFRRTGRYNEPFLKSLERGLKESSFFRSRR